MDEGLGLVPAGHKCTRLVTETVKEGLQIYKEFSHWFKTWQHLEGNGRTNGSLMYQFGRNVKLVLGIVSVFFYSGVTLFRLTTKKTPNVRVTGPW